MTGTLVPALPDAVERAAADLLKAICAADLTLATAESCTGGMLAALLTDVEGASHADIALAVTGFAEGGRATKPGWSTSPMRRATDRSRPPNAITAMSVAARSASRRSGRRSI